MDGEGPERAFYRTVVEGEDRLGRSWPALVATGLVGGMDVGIGLMALLIVRHETGSPLLGAVAFSIGFIALTLASSELFTEDFLIPLSAVAAGRSRWTSVPRLWGTTLAANLLGGWVLAGLVVAAFPALRPTAVELGGFYDRIGIGWESLALAMLGGLVITLVTWMIHSTTSAPAKLIAAATGGFLLAAGPLNHSVVGSLEMFAALQAGTDFGYARWAQLTAWAVLGNVIGGVGLVTTLRFVQVGQGPIEDQRHQAEATAEPGPRPPTSTTRQPRSSPPTGRSTAET